jgi:GTP-binding protein
VIRVPPGTQIRSDDGALHDLVRPGQRALAARGGSGGRGNKHFATPTRQSPRFAERGLPGEERWLELSLKLLADVGLVGLPNAGKSTLLSRLTRAAPKIADYPFTTLVPNLGIVRTGEQKTFVMADIPGLIEGASEGAGLGHRFLRHVERVSVLAFLVEVSPVEGRTPALDYATLVRELSLYSEDLAKKPRVLVLTKGDLPETRTAAPEVKALAEREGIPFFEISAVRGDGLDALAYALQAIVDEGRLKSSSS